MVCTHEPPPATTTPDILYEKPALRRDAELTTENPSGILVLDEARVRALIEERFQQETRRERNFWRRVWRGLLAVARAIEDDKDVRSAR
jgi:hypothetical protein